VQFFWEKFFLRRDGIMRIKNIFVKFLMLVITISLFSCGSKQYNPISSGLSLKTRDALFQSSIILQDNFNDGIIDTTKWMVGENPYLSVNEENGYLKIYGCLRDTLDTQVAGIVSIPSVSSQNRIEIETYVDVTNTIIAVGSSTKIWGTIIIFDNNQPTVAYSIGKTSNGYVLAYGLPGMEPTKITEIPVGEGVAKIIYENGIGQLLWNGSLVKTFTYTLTGSVTFGLVGSNFTRLPGEFDINDTEDIRFDNVLFTGTPVSISPIDRLVNRLKDVLQKSKDLKNEMEATLVSLNVPNRGGFLGQFGPAISDIEDAIVRLQKYEFSYCGNKIISAMNRLKEIRKTLLSARGKWIPSDIVDKWVEELDSIIAEMNSILRDIRAGWNPSGR
jgi:hypothetical protein